MTHSEYSDYRYIISGIKADLNANNQPIYWHIRTDYSSDMKRRVDAALRSMAGFFPCRVGAAGLWRDELEYIVYIPYDSEAAWLECTLPRERMAIEEALAR